MDGWNRGHGSFRVSEAAEGGRHEETGGDGVRLALGARGESIGRKEVTEGRIDVKILV